MGAKHKSAKPIARGKDLGRGGPEIVAVIERIAAHNGLGDVEGGEYTGGSIDKIARHLFVFFRDFSRLGRGLIKPVISAIPTIRVENPFPHILRTGRKGRAHEKYLCRYDQMIPNAGILTQHPCGGTGLLVSRENKAYQAAMDCLFCFHLFAI
ncbi:MAG: hypothetical protein KGI97_06930 [Alphaproteobacteria bacterium]|nr:hypothetical protein [Alphaproteobacteria bacterium]